MAEGCDFRICGYSLRKSQCSVVSLRCVPWDRIRIKERSEIRVDRNPDRWRFYIRCCLQNIGLVWKSDHLAPESAPGIARFGESPRWILNGEPVDVASTTSAARRCSAIEPPV